MRLALVAASVAVALVLTRTIRRETAAHERASARAELGRTLAKEANHRIKNDLQTVADLLLLGRPGGEDGTAFDETAARIRSIATVHRLLTEADDRVDGGALLRSIAESAPMPVAVEAEPAAFDAATAQKLGIVANELVTNAFRHGAPPIVVRLSGGAPTAARARRLSSPRRRNESAHRRGRSPDRPRPLRTAPLARTRADRAGVRWRAGDRDGTGEPARPVPVRYRDAEPRRPRG